VSTTYQASIYIGGGRGEASGECMLTLLTRVIEALRVASGTAMFYAWAKPIVDNASGFDFVVQQTLGLASPIYRGDGKNEQRLARSMLRAIRRVVGTERTVEINVLDLDKALWVKVESEGQPRLRLIQGGRR